MAAPPARARADYDYLIKLLLIGDSGQFIGGPISPSISSLDLREICWRRGLGVSSGIWFQNRFLLMFAKCEWVNESKISNHLRALVCRLTFWSDRVPTCTVQYTVNNSILLHFENRCLDLFLGVISFVTVHSEFRQSFGMFIPQAL